MSLVEPTPETEEQRLCRAVQQQLCAAIAAVEGVVSVTIVGSFVDRASFAGISDIDVIVVLSTLTETGFQACRAAAGTLANHPAFAGKRFHINDTFGPLKFDTSECAVVHLMVYDVESHRDHVLQSPFTCLDWERSQVCRGTSLRAVYPVLGLQPRDFVAARRGLRNYLADLAAGQVSYRRLEFRDGRASQVPDRHPIDARHSGEFAYHIISSTISNHLKLIDRSNTRLDTPAQITRWREELPRTARHADDFQRLADLKRARSKHYPEDTLARTAAFLEDFEAEITALWETTATRIVFVRHGRTALNDGTFLGQRRDPALLEPPEPSEVHWLEVWSSPALRARETAAALAPGATPKIDARLGEIDYGEAEGLRFAELDQRFPELRRGWEVGEDPRFPGGENTSDVVARLRSVLAELDGRPGPILVATHNVVLRCLLGDALGLPARLWHLLPVAHLERFELRLLRGRVYLNLEPEQRARITDAVLPHLNAGT